MNQRDGTVVKEIEKKEEKGEVDPKAAAVVVVGGAG